MTIQEIPLTADNQQFSIVLGGVTWRISIIWRDLYWIMDLQNDRGEPVTYNLAIRKRILETRGVKSILSFNTTVDTTTRRVMFSAEIDTLYGITTVTSEA